MQDIAGLRFSFYLFKSLVCFIQVMQFLGKWSEIIAKTHVFRCSFLCCYLIGRMGGIAKTEGNSLCERV